MCAHMFCVYEYLERTVALKQLRSNTGIPYTIL